MRAPGSFEREPDDVDDVWPLELWLSREDALPEDDTWHVGRTRGVGSPTGRALRSVVDAWRRVPRAGAGRTRIGPVRQT